jgi:hypothetical protein
MTVSGEHRQQRFQQHDFLVLRERGGLHLKVGDEFVLAERGVGEGALHGAAMM